MKMLIFTMLLGMVTGSRPSSIRLLEHEAAWVFAAMHDDLLRCLARTRGSAFITIDVLVGADGFARTVRTTGGALAGPTAMRCIERRVARAVFPPPVVERRA